MVVKDATFSLSSLITHTGSSVFTRTMPRYPKSDGLVEMTHRARIHMFTISSKDARKLRVSGLIISHVSWLRIGNQYTGVLTPNSLVLNQETRLAEYVMWSPWKDLHTQFKCSLGKRAFEHVYIFSTNREIVIHYLRSKHVSLNDEIRWWQILNYRDCGWHRLCLIWLWNYTPLCGVSCYD